MFYKLSDYAQKFNVTYRTAWNRFKAGKIPGAFFDETNHVCIPIKTLDVSCKKVAIYSNNRTQEEMLKNFCIINGFTIEESIIELNPNNKLNKLLCSTNWDILVVENKNIIAKDNFFLIENLLESKGQQILVIDKSK
jgi:predicted site-specific integrase-resolvase